MDLLASACYPGGSRATWRVQLSIPACVAQQPAPSLLYSTHGVQTGRWDSGQSVAAIPLWNEVSPWAAGGRAPCTTFDPETPHIQDRDEEVKPAGCSPKVVADAVVTPF